MSALSALHLRPAEPGDAPRLLALKHQLDRESSFMLVEPGERRERVEDVVDELRLGPSTNSVVIVAEAGTDLVGYIEATGGRFARDRATAYLVMGVLSAHSGAGVGGRLLEAVTRWASARGLRRLELTVMAHNRRAIGLYERSGFEVEGRRRRCLLADDEWVDELYMGKLLPAAT